MPFVKLDCGILDSSLWAEPPAVRLTFLTMLAMAEPDGLCRATAPGISHRARLPRKDVEKALGVLEAGDPNSRDNTDGRRISRVAGGFMILNYVRYREHDYGARERMRALRQKRKADVPNVPHGSGLVTQAEAEAEADKAKAVVNTPFKDNARRPGRKLDEILDASIRKELSK